MESDAPVANFSQSGGFRPGASQSSDRFMTIQTGSMDTTCNPVEDRTHDFFP